MIPKVDLISSLDGSEIKETVEMDTRSIGKQFLELVDWKKLYFRLLDYRHQKGWSNLVFDMNTLKEIIEKNEYTLYCPEQLIRPVKFENLWQVEEIVTSILKKYLSSFYTRRKNSWMRNNIEIVPLSEDHGNLSIEEYSLKVENTEYDDIVKEEIVPYRTEEQWKTLIPKEEEALVGNRIKRLYFDRHFYQPLLVQPDKIESHPEGLNPGETEFIKDLNIFYQTNQSLFEDAELYVLRNLPRKGVGFYDTSYFYPDFILWMIKGDKQHMIFVDPKGLVHAFDALSEEKIELFKDIKILERDIQTRLGYENITLDSFIVSVTPYRNIRGTFHLLPRTELEKHHILFQHDDKMHYIEKLFKAVIAS